MKIRKFDLYKTTKVIAYDGRYYHTIHHATVSNKGFSESEKLSGFTLTVEEDTENFMMAIYGKYFFEKLSEAIAAIEFLEESGKLPFAFRSCEVDGDRIVEID